MTEVVTRLRGRAGLVAALATLMLGSAGAAVSLTSASAATHTRAHHTHRRHQSCIPQGSHAGDRDSDNHGGPSDGDGCM